MSTVIPDISPSDLLGRFRGTVSDAHNPSSSRVRLDVRDGAGGKWHLVSWEASYVSSETGRLEGKVIVEVGLDPASEVLTVGFSDNSQLTLTPQREPAEEAIEDWELFTPDGLVLAYGPRGHWQLSRSDGSGESWLLHASKPGAPFRDSREWKQACREMKLDEDERELASRDLHAFQSAEEAGR
jgi:hypothetical protein